ncbi:hypothetical protein BGX26_009702, partial [Mortierella sp. AD094]
MGKLNKSRKHVLELAAAKRARTGKFQGLSEEVCEELEELGRDAQEWNDIDAEGDSDDEHVDSQTKEKWDGLLAKMRSRGWDHGEHLRDPCRGT